MKIQSLPSQEEGEGEDAIKKKATTKSLLHLIVHPN
jgi:hypothetical protein